MAKKSGTAVASRKRRTTVDARDLKARALIRAHDVFMEIPKITLKSVWETTRLNDTDPEAKYIRELISWKDFTAASGPGDGDWLARRKTMWGRIFNKLGHALESGLTERKAKEVAALEEVFDLGHKFAVGGMAKDSKGVEREVKPATTAKELHDAAKVMKDALFAINIQRTHIVATVAAAAAAEGRGALEEAAALEDKAPGALDDRIDDDDVVAMAMGLAARRAGVLPSGDGGGEGL